ncbi:L,D-transpeptidase [Amycolatopsis benzoatilytica]|uniref:L,D-transpeptidase n=1 Tax=Amycolatopsis benzoatilytica TaxID=346045 RepID=UPI00047F9C7C|nr:L,D-transpeptidase [Amycolatopsis benzoatilytica]
MKRLLAAVAAAAMAFGLAACSGGGATGSAAAGGVSPAAANVPVSSSAPANSSAPASTPASTSSAPSTQQTTPKPAPKPQPKADPAPTADVPCAAAAAASGTSACVDISAHRAWLLQDGKVIDGPVSMLPGGKGHATPTGTFHVLSKEKVHLSKEFDDAPMPNSVFFYPGDAFHTGSLKVYSHGCIHLSAASSLRFFNTLHVGDVVQVIP